MMSPKIWDTTEDGTIDIIQLHPDKMDGALEVMKKGFFMHENVCVAVELPQHPQAIKELEGLCLHTAKDGVSVIAVERATGIVVGAAFNKLQVKNSTEEESNYFQRYLSNCKFPSSRGVLQFMIDADATCNLFEHCRVDCLLEIMFLGTIPECRGRKIATKLCEVSIKLAQLLKTGENIKVSVDNDNQLPLQPVPKLVSAIFTSFISQRIGKTLGFQVAVDISYEKFTYNGQTYAEKLGPANKTTSTTLAFKQI